MQHIRKMFSTMGFGDIPFSTKPKWQHSPQPQGNQEKHSTEEQWAAGSDFWWQRPGLLQNFRYIPGKFQVFQAYIEVLVLEINVYNSKLPNMWPFQLNFYLTQNGSTMFVFACLVLAMVYNGSNGYVSIGLSQIWNPQIIKIPIVQGITSSWGYNLEISCLRQAYIVV